MRFLCLLVALTTLDGAFVWADDKPVIREGDSKLPFKERHQFGSTTAWPCYGVVTEIKKDTLTVRDKDRKTGEDQDHTFHALDIYKAGQIQDWVSGSGAYRWQDVKKGDTVTLQVRKAPDDGKEYVIQIRITRRPGEKLPKSQQPDKDSHYRWESFLNDIDNGEDKTEKEINELFPPEINHRTGGMIRPTTFPAEYRGKLNAIRDKLDAEKEKDLKATPPEKK